MTSFALGVITGVIGTVIVVGGIAVLFLIKLFSSINR